MNPVDWKKADQWLRARIADTQRRLEGDLSPEATAQQRGRIRAWRAMLEWASEGFPPEANISRLLDAGSTSPLPPQNLTGTSYE